MEFLIGLFTGYMLGWPSLVVLICLGIFAETCESHVWAVLLGIVTAVVAFFFFKVDFMSILGYALAYFIIGFAWSIWRYRRHASDVVAAHKDSDSISQRYALKQLHPTEMLGKLTAWVIVWPFSIIENVTGDFIKLVHTMITKFFRRIYLSIYQSAESQLKLAKKE